MIDAAMKAVRDMAISAYALAAGIFVLVEQMTTWIGFVSAILGCIGTIYVIYNQRRLHLEGKRRAKAAKNS